VITPEQLKNALCAAFCSAFEVNVVPSGYAVSSIFMDRSGDRINFYLVAEDGGYRLEDDGEYLSRLVASGIEIERGQRGQLLDAILESEKAYWIGTHLRSGQADFLNRRSRNAPDRSCRR
jgi:hypothetical protein